MSMQKMHPKKNRSASWVKHTEEQAKRKKKKGGGSAGGTRPSPPGTPVQTSTGRYFLYGRHPVSAALENPRRKIHRLIATRNGAESLPPAPPGLTVEIGDAHEMARLLPPGAVHQGVMLEVDFLEEPLLEDCLAAGKPVILLDQVTDPHNVGAILRSAAAFDACAVIVPKHNAPEETGVMAKSSSGGIEIVPILRVPNLVSAMEELKKAGYWCAGLDGTAQQTIREANLSRKTALVLGAEGAGLRRLTAENCDLLVRLPISGQMESLNVSNAAAIALYELFQT